MGYDLTSVGELKRGQKNEFPTFGEEEDAGTHPYFRLNVWGMGEMRQIMWEAGVADDEFPVPTWPTNLSADEDDEDEEFRLACDKARSAAPTSGKVPLYKFGSNDGWVVTPKECRTIAAGLKSLIASRRPVPVHRWAENLKGTSVAVLEPDDEMMSYAAKFARFNAVCADLGGYEVW